MVNSCAKGKRGERRVANLYKGIFPKAARNYQPSGAITDGADVRGVPFWVESKSYSRLRHAEVYDWISVLPKDKCSAIHVKTDGSIPIVILREDDWLSLVSRIAGNDAKGPWEDWSQQ